MPFAAYVTSLSGHAGTVTGPGAANVLIGGLPAAVAGDSHTCPLPFHGATPFARGSASVYIGGRPALRVGDLAGCGAPVLVGNPTVMVGG